MTATIESPTSELEIVTLDLYRDIHKGIRAELFAVTSEAGALDPADQFGRTDLARHVDSVVDLLVAHAQHEDAHIEPTLHTHLPQLAERIASDHVALETTMTSLRGRAAAVVDAPPVEQRDQVHRLYVDLAAFTSRYLAHQDVEERVVMPALERAVGVDAVMAIEQSIVGSIPPDEMVQALSVMLPAMNIEDRTEMLGGMKAGAPPEVFAGVWSLAGSVLPRADVIALAARLGIE